MVQWSFIKIHFFSIRYLMNFIYIKLIQGYRSQWDEGNKTSVGWGWGPEVVQVDADEPKYFNEIKTEVLFEAYEIFLDIVLSALKEENVSKAKHLERKHCVFTC